MILLFKVISKVLICCSAFAIKFAINSHVFVFITKNRHFITVLKSFLNFDRLLRFIFAVWLFLYWFAFSLIFKLKTVIDSSQFNSSHFDSIVLIRLSLTSIPFRLSQNHFHQYQRQFTFSMLKFFSWIEQCLLNLEFLSNYF